MNIAQIFVGDNRKTLKQIEAGSAQTCITSPPYWGLRDYGHGEQIGLEDTPDEYVEQLCLVFDEVWRVLSDDGTLWLNLGDSYLGKQLAGIPWQVAFALQKRGWFLRSEIIWAKPNPMPESVTDRPTKSHEHLFLLVKSAKYFYDHEAVKEPLADSTVRIHSSTKVRPRAGSRKQDLVGNGHSGLVNGNLRDGMRNKRDVWTIPTQPYTGAHFAVYPPALIEPCVLAGSREGDTVLDPFSGAGTTGVVALRNFRNYVGLELNPDYARLGAERIQEDAGMFGEVTIHGEK